MKLKYYMRGLGIGILVTAILMGVAGTKNHKEMTDDEIVERAKALGMEMKYESGVLSDMEAKEETEKVVLPEQEKPKEQDTEPIETEKPTAEQIELAQTQPQQTQTQPTQTSETEQSVGEIEEIEEIKETEQPQKNESEDESAKENTMSVEIVVQGGDGSLTVSKKLVEAGVIEDAKVYDKYLCSNGYDKKICTGTHVIPLGATEEEIAKIITTRKKK